MGFNKYLTYIHHESITKSILTALKIQEYTEELYKKDLHDPDNHDDVITNLEPDTLECEVIGP